MATTTSKRVTTSRDILPSRNGRDVTSETVDEPTGATIILDRLAVETLRIPIIGLTPLITHRFSEKAKKQMLDAMQGKKSPKVAKDPEAEYEAAFYRFEDAGWKPGKHGDLAPVGGAGLPVTAFKQATVGGARLYQGVTMRELKQYLFFRGDIGLDGQSLARIEGDPKLREDVVRVGRGGTDLRYRPEFREWRTDLIVTYVMSSLTRQSVLSLIDAGGMGVGVGEWRVERDGDFGTYVVDESRDVEVIR